MPAARTRKKRAPACNAVREKGAAAGRVRAKEETAHADLVSRAVGADKRMKQRWKEGKEFLVQLLEFASSNRLEESTEKREVVQRLCCVRGVTGRQDHDSGQVRPQHRLVLWKEGDRPEYQLEES